MDAPKLRPKFRFLDDSHPKKEAKIYHPLITLAILIVVMVYAVVLNGGTPQIPLIIGIAAGAVVTNSMGYSWKDILEFMIAGVIPAIEALFILLLIGCLVGTWLSSGTISTMVYFGLSLLSAQWFLPAAMLICGIVSFAIGAWGTIGTVGIALLGIGIALEVPLPLVAGCIVSGSYFGDAVSPLSDATNLCAAVVSRDVFAVVKQRMAPVIAAFILALIAFAVVGFMSATSGGAEATQGAAELQQKLSSLFNISWVALLPMAAVLICIALKVPALPSMFVGIVSGIACAHFLQGVALSDLIAICLDGNASNTGDELIDTLLTGGGLTSMMETISIVFIAMAFGGLMQKSGQMTALVKPIVSRVKTFGPMNGVAVISCACMNVVLPDQYLGMAVPGQMYEQEYDKRGYDRVTLSTALVGGAVTSSLIPWNTCGIYCYTLLGVSPIAYAPCAFFNLIAIVLIIGWGFVKSRKVEAFAGRGFEEAEQNDVREGTFAADSAQA